MPLAANTTVDEDAESQHAQQTKPSSVAVGKARRRKTPSHVSSNACTNCKKARAKVSTLKYKAHLPNPADHR